MAEQLNDNDGSYVIELDRFGIDDKGLMPAETTEGINAALEWAKAQGFNHVILPSGSYKVKQNPNSLAAIKMLSGIHLELERDCVIELEPNTSPNYAIIKLEDVHHAKLTGGKLIGDKKQHSYEINIKFERGGVNPDGSLNDNPKWIRSEVLDRYEHPGLLSNFRLWSIDGVSAAGYQFYQYKDSVAPGNLVGSRTNGSFAPANPSGRGWFLNEEGDMARNNKMIFAIPLTNALTDSQIAAIRAKVDNVYYTHEGGHGIHIAGSSHITISHVEITNCTGDGIYTTWLNYYVDASQYTQEQMGSHIRIQSCHIHHCRRQGISLCAPNDIVVQANRIHHIGYDDDGSTTNFRNGTPPMFGIDIESMVGETNIPILTPDRPDGLELNYRIHIRDNVIANNARGHVVNADGSYVTLENNIFEGKNVGGISSNPNYPNVKFINNIFNSCELWVQGDNFVNGAIFNKGNLRLLDVRGAVVQNCKVKEGLVYGSSIYGYFGTPVVNAAAGTFTYASPHGMGNGAQISFEQWIGKVPAGISVDKLYYTVNVTATSFQVAETSGGAPVKLADTGQAGFNISRIDYGVCFLSNITIERDWRPDNALTRNLNLTVAGAVLKNLTVKNYDVSVMSPPNYAGRPTIIDGLTLIEGAARFEACQISNAQFIRAKTGAMGATDIQLGITSAQYTRKVTLHNGLLQGLGLVLDGNAIVTNSSFMNAVIGKADNANKAVVTNSYLENTNVNLQWLRQDHSVTIAGSTFKDVKITGGTPYVVLVDNTDISVK